MFQFQLHWTAVVHQWKHRFLNHHHLQMLRSLVLTLLVSVYSLLLSLQSQISWAISSTPSSLSYTGPSLVAMGGFGAVIRPNKAPSPPNWNMKYYKSVEFLSFFRMSSPAAQTQSPSIEDFLDRSLKHLWEHSKLHQTTGFVAWF